MNLVNLHATTGGHDRVETLVDLRSFRVCQIANHGLETQGTGAAFQGAAVEHMYAVRKILSRLMVVWSAGLVSCNSQDDRRSWVLQGLWCILTATLQVAAERLGSNWRILSRLECIRHVKLASRLCRPTRRGS